MTRGLEVRALAARRVRSASNAARRRLGIRIADDRGAGSVLAIAVAAGAVCVASMLLVLCGAIALKHGVQAAAEAAALAAADSASGAIAGYPCEQAARAAELSGAALESCDVVGEVAAVTVSRTILGVPVTARARAGPPLTSACESAVCI